MSATAAQPKTTDRVYNRAPKGGMVDPISGRFFKGGQFCFLYTAEQLAVVARPAPLVGSSRQVLWATRLRAEAIAAADRRMADLLANIGSVRRDYRALVRMNVEAAATERHRFATATSAAAVIAMAKA